MTARFIYLLIDFFKHCLNCSVILFITAESYMNNLNDWDVRVGMFENLYFWPAIVECRDIYVYQRPLIGHFENFEQTDFLDAKYLIRPMFHCIGLLWGSSRYYCSVEKLIRMISLFYLHIFSGNLWQARSRNFIAMKYEMHYFEHGSTFIY